MEEVGEARTEEGDRGERREVSIKSGVMLEHGLKSQRGVCRWSVRLCWACVERRRNEWKCGWVEWMLEREVLDLGGPVSGWMVPTYALSSRVS